VNNELTLAVTIHCYGDQITARKQNRKRDFNTETSGTRHRQTAHSRLDLGDCEFLGHGNKSSW